MSHVVTAASFAVPSYVCKMQRRQADDEAVFYESERIMRAVRLLAARVAPMRVCTALVEIERRLASVEKYGKLVITAAEFGQDTIDDVRALRDWVDAIGGGTVEDPDNMMCLPNTSRIGKPGFCRFCGTRGGTGSCCD